MVCRHTGAADRGAVESPQQSWVGGVAVDAQSSTEKPEEKGGEGWSRLGYCRLFFYSYYR